ncbi:MAG: flagellar basal body-associated FliL family protein, partial [Candidatus Marinimicrobia bacterium]|nr:flagellar basal body-associated FliL family protein [Candidatus Neomarinimicrobiota bacterium]
EWPEHWQNSDDENVTSPTSLKQGAIAALVASDLDEKIALTRITAKKWFDGLIGLGGSVAAPLYFAGVFPGMEEASSEESAGKEEGKKAKKGKSKKEAKEPPIYLAFEAPFVVNFIDKNQIRYLQINVEVMARDEAVIEGVKAHTPKIINNLLILFSDLDFETITSVAGKQKLRDLALEEIRKILKEETGKNEVEALYFTGFVMQ